MQDGSFFVPDPDGNDIVAHVHEWEVGQNVIDLDRIREIPDEDTARADELAGLDDAARDR